MAASQNGPGWRQHPADGGDWRWHDGSAWTAQVLTRDDGPPVGRPVAPALLVTVGAVLVGTGVAMDSSASSVSALVGALLVLIGAAVAGVGTIAAGVRHGLALTAYARQGRQVVQRSAPLD